MWGALGAGAAGWLLLAAGAGKASDWPAFRRGLAEGRLLPEWAVPVVAAIIPPLELLAGLGTLAAPGPRTLIPAGVLFGLFAAYQAELLQRGNAADCNCYGRLRQIKPGPTSILGSVVLATVAIALGEGAGSAGGLGLRLVAGALLAGAYLIAAGRGRASGHWSGFPYAEVHYLRHRLAGEPDAAARAAVALEFGLGVGATYMLVPRTKAWWLVAEARWKQWRGR